MSKWAMLVIDMTWELMQFETLPLLVMCVTFLISGFLCSAWVDRYL